MSISLFKALMTYNSDLYNNIGDNIPEKKALTTCKRIEKLMKIYIMFEKNLKKVIK